MKRDSFDLIVICRDSVYDQNVPNTPRIHPMNFDRNAGQYKGNVLQLKLCPLYQRLSVD